MRKTAVLLALLTLPLISEAAKPDCTTSHWRLIVTTIWKKSATSFEMCYDTKHEATEATDKILAQNPADVTGKSKDIYLDVVQVFTDEQ